MISLEEFGRFRFCVMPNPFNIANESILTITNISKDPGEGYIPRAIYKGSEVRIVAQPDLPISRYSIDLASEVDKPELVEIIDFDNISMVAAKVLSLELFGFYTRLELDLGETLGLAMVQVQNINPKVDLIEKSIIVITNIEPSKDEISKVRLISFSDFRGYVNLLFSSKWVPPGTRFTL